MSSSDDVLSWAYFTATPAPPRFALRAPAAEVAEILRRYHDELDTCQRAAAETVDEVRAQLAEQAVLVFHLGNTIAQLANGDLRRRLSIVRDQMSAALNAAGITVQDPAGAAYRDVEQFVDVTAWREDPTCTDEVVAETAEPVVRHGDRVIRHGRVIGGTPTAPSTPPPTPPPIHPGAPQR